ncbi:MAG: phospho-N-acetylmuramoyl-pentapeptide-transferase [Holosporales bacterium]|jgi:phospho-N-acetylmuramoyl-pentapeptide-transferase|nr:phospho-N-acetylmuramoyl-pentapeptide-transferase [Holosporales bacterium]
MFYNLLYPLSGHFPYFNIFKYLTVRTAGALLTALLLALFFGSPIINLLKKKQQNGQPIRAYSPENHLAKSGTPTMGGILILGATLVSVFLWADLTNPFIAMSVFVLLGFGCIGAYDDWLKLSTGKSNGMKSRWKFAAQSVLSLVITYAILKLTPRDLYCGVTIPFFKNYIVYIGYGYFIWGICVITGASNAVNLTDGLDGLAIVPAMYVGGSFLLISYLTGHAHFSDYLYIHYIPKSGELAVFLGAMIGGSLGFLWFNAPPAKVFMGDSGSLSIGAVLGSIAMMVHHELVLSIVGGLFVIEAVSVILQVLFFKISHGKRIFLMAPIHHHFEKKGWPEPTITIRFWIITTVLALIGLMTLKIR